MLEEYRKQSSYQKLLEKAISNIKKTGFDEIKADFEGMELPAKLVNRSTEQVFIPDATAKNRNGIKAYFEISCKVTDTEPLVSKWKLIDTLAKMKEGIFKIFVPSGTMRFTQELITQHNINATLVKI
ncbi:MAG: hypothetical protein KTR26_11400 [Flammeovirgaceae bacterium]|nr:hypothetical protein [Flammeovirgaceae bacterium]